MLVALCVVMNVALKWISIPHFGFLSFSFAPTIIVFSSLTLGPIYGAVVGGVSDLISAFLFPTGAYNFILTIVYALLGVLPFLFRLLFSKFQKALSKPYIFWILMVMIFGILSYFLYGTDYLDSRFGDAINWAKPLVLALAGILEIALVVALIFLEKRSKNRGEESIYVLASNVAVSEYICLVLLRALAYYLYFIVISSTGYRVAYPTLVAMLSISLPLEIFITTFCLPFMANIVKIYER